MVLPRSSRVSRAPPYSRIMPVLPVRGYHPLRPSFPERSSYISIITGLVRVRSPLLTESQLMSFPPGTEMFQFSGFAPSRVTLQCRVSPFGNLRIKGYSHLPTAYRSVLRPSSPLNAKASTKCPLRRLIAPYTKAESNLPLYGTQAMHMNAVKLHMQMFLRSNSLTLSNSCHIMANSFQYIL